jgi:hypothetical protein
LGTGASTGSTLSDTVAQADCIKNRLSKRTIFFFKVASHQTSGY